MNTSALRTRWAEIGAAVTIGVGGGGLGIAHATVGSGERTVFVPINPCRLADTRAEGHHVGDVAGPLTGDATVTLAAHGPHGNCNLPAGATGVVLNVTAVGPSAPTFLTLYPTGSPRPVASSLNPMPGSPPTPNAVTVDLDTNGRFDVYNLAGTVDVVVDVVGYYEHHTHDDRYYTKTQVDQQIDAAVTQALADRYSNAQVDQQIDAAVTQALGERYTNAQVDAAVGAVTPIAFDETFDAGETQLLATLAGTELSATCDSPSAATFSVNGDSFWLYGFNSGPAEFDVRVGPVSTWSRNGTADYLFFNGVLYSDDSYYQLAVYSGHVGEGCIFWGVATPAFR